MTGLCQPNGCNRYHLNGGDVSVGYRGRGGGGGAARTGCCQETGCSHLGGIESSSTGIADGNGVHGLPSIHLWPSISIIKSIKFLQWIRLISHPNSLNGFNLIIKFQLISTIPLEIQREFIRANNRQTSKVAPRIHEDRSTSIEKSVGVAEGREKKLRHQLINKERNEIAWWWPE